MDKGKMSKSAGEFLTLPSLIAKGYDALDYRFFCMQAHYRAQLGFSFESLDAAKAGRAGLMQKLDELVGVKGISGAEAEALPQWKKFWEALEDDLNAPRAIASLFDLTRDSTLSKEQKAGLVILMDTCLGLKLLEPRQAKAQPALPPDLQAMVDARAKARADKEWKKSDELRDALKARGILIKDSKDGQSWEKI